MNTNAEQHPDDLASALALLAEERARRIAAEAEAATAKAEAALAEIGIVDGPGHRHLNARSQRVPLSGSVGTVTTLPRSRRIVKQGDLR